jgi:murein peptide amidase A
VRLFALVSVSLLLAGSAASLGGPRRVVLGRSFEGRPIVAYELGDPTSSRKVLVVGCLHGNECAGTAILDRLRRLGPLGGTDLWLVPDANPDGHAAGARGNARGVDLNRNFPWRWRPLGGVYDSGRAPASERETRIAMRLIQRVRPKVTIWFHQHLNMVVLTSGNLGLQRRFARLAGLRAGRLPNYPGTATGWQNARLPGTTAFVVELPSGRLSPPAVARYARAVRSVSVSG